MKGNTQPRSKIFNYIVYAMLAIGSLMIIRKYTAPKQVDDTATKDITLFLENKIGDIDQKLKAGITEKDISTRLSWHKSNAALYNEAKSYKDDTVKKQSEALKERIVLVQVRDFPELREAYTKSKEEVLSKENINIIASGSTHDTLTFTGGIFAPKTNKKQFLKGIDQIVKDLRFKKVVFKWSEKKEDFTDYNIQSKTDAEI